VQVQASIIVRSYNRVHALCELVDNLLSQDYDSYEVIIVEQSTKYEQKDWNKLLELSKDSRITLLKFEPLAGPKARNEGVLNASGEILLFVDDDDLPVNNQWIKQHVEAYNDEYLVGFTGRHIFQGKNHQCTYAQSMRYFIRMCCMSYNWLKFPYTFAQFDENVDNVGWLHGTNSSIRRDWVLKVGLWETNVVNQDEHSFAFKLHKHLKNGYRLDFKIEPALIRRMDIDGGMGKRKFSMKRSWNNHYSYMKNIIFKFHPNKKALYPFMVLWIIYKVLGAKLKDYSKV
tara:strand:+ start:2098 stop:2958 length:861 start_codon:yes stop_codon:yes gene_type:complete